MKTHIIYFFFSKNDKQEGPFNKVREATENNI